MIHIHTEFKQEKNKTQQEFSLFGAALRYKTSQYLGRVTTAFCSELSHRQLLKTKKQQCYTLHKHTTKSYST